MDINSTKGIILATLFSITLICICLPFKVITAINRTIDPSQRRRYKQAISLLTCYGGGVFLAACLLDLFPESRESLNKILDTNHVHSKFPVAEFVMVFGFFIVFVAEQLVMFWKEVTSPFEIKRPRIHRESQTVIQGICDHSVQCQSISAADADHILEESDDHSIISQISDENVPHSTLRTCILLVSLSLHSVFEGIAIGLQPAIDSVVQLFIVVIIHKSVIAFSLGLSIVQSNLSRGMTVLACVLFCSSSPLGMGIGIGLEDLQDSVAANVASGILQGLACGTFLYVTFFEILPHEMNSKRNRMFKVVCILLGFSTICTVLFFDPTN